MPERLRNWIWRSFAGTLDVGIVRGADEMIVKATLAAAA
jgi:hypothetical protein